MSLVHVLASSGFEHTADQPETMKRCEGRLQEAVGSNMDCLLKVTVWLRDQRDAEEFDRIYRTYFSGRDTLPARTRIQAGRTPMDCGLEVEAIGFVPKKSKAHRRRRSRRK